MTNQFQKNLCFLVFFSAVILFTHTACDKEDSEPKHPYNGKTRVEFNSNLSYGILTDQEGNEYKTIKIGEQTWMAENLRVTIFRNGDPIPEINSFMAFNNATEAAWCNYSGVLSEEGIATYGRLYNWYAASDERNIAPEGWHVPPQAEWETLINYLIENGYNADGSPDTAPNKLAKSLACKNLWYESLLDYPFAVYNLGSSSFPEKRNASGFSAVPSGIRIGAYEGFYQKCFWWCANGGSTKLDFEYSSLSAGGRMLNDGLSLRCIKDN